MILISFIASGLFFWAIDYSLDKGWLEIRTTTIGYAVTSLILGFLVVWFTYISIEWLYKRKKNKMWPW
jgi:hypothetical protein